MKAIALRTGYYFGVLVEEDTVFELREPCLTGLWFRVIGEPGKKKADDRKGSQGQKDDADLA